MTKHHIEDYPVLFEEFMAAKEARNATVAKARDKLDAARAAFHEALKEANADTGFTEARDRLQAFRRWARGEGYSLTDPTKAIPGVSAGPTIQVGGE